MKIHKNTHSSPHFPNNYFHLSACYCFHNAGVMQVFKTYRSQNYFTILSQFLLTLYRYRCLSCFRYLFLCVIQYICFVFSTLDIDECLFSPSVCGPHSNCTNERGSYNCSCLDGFTVTNSNLTISINNTCRGTVQICA